MRSPPSRTSRFFRRARASLLAAAALALVACEKDTRTLGLSDEDGGPADVIGDREDGGVLDSDSWDVGPLPSCGPGQTFELSLSGFDPRGYEGPLYQTATGVLAFATEDETGAVRFFGPTPQVLLGQPGFWARLELYQPFWVEARLTLWRLGPDGRPADLAFVAWSGSSWGSLEEGRVSYVYAPAVCEAFDESCGRANGADLVVELPEERPVVGYGERLAAESYEVFNGRSHQYVGGALCPDTPSQWYEGWIAIEPGPSPDCASLPRDDCIATPRCVLWGSELYDPGYVCVPAEGACEPRTEPIACSGGPCEWDPGECYCPEGEDCFCAGGPAPKCRAQCGGSRGVCPTGRFCDDPTLRLPLCEPEPGAFGLCEWIPTQCSDIPSTRPVCGCAPGDDGTYFGRTYPDDCAARQDQASDRTPGPCPG